MLHRRAYALFGMFAIFCIQLSFASHVEAFSQMKRASDLITTSAPGAATGHELTMTLTSGIPSSGSLVVDLAGSSPFNIPEGFSFADVDLAVATSSDDYVEYALASTTDMTTATTSAVTVTSGDNGSIAVTLGPDSSLAIPAGARIRMRFGSLAKYEYSGSWPITNPENVGAGLIRLHTEDGAQKILDKADILIYVVEPTGMTSMVIGRETLMSNPLPKGLLPGGTKKVYMSMETDLPAYCRWDTTSSSTPYDQRLSSNQFSDQDSNRHHYRILDVADNNHYTFYVRCFTKYGLQENLTGDLVIDFEVGMVPNEPRPPAPPPRPPGTQEGTGAGGGNQQFQSGVTIAGRTFPGAQVVVLKDGKDFAHPSVGGDGSWQTEASQLDRGSYGFSMFAVDSKSQMTARYNAVLAVTPKTRNTIGPVLMSPTLSAPGNRIEPGQKTTVSGYAISGEKVFLVVLTPTDPMQQPLLTGTTLAKGDGSWSMTLSTENFGKGTYDFKAQSQVTGKGDSLFSADYLIGVGEAPKGVKGAADINHDGKVNLSDLSMLLAHWGQSYPMVDLNGNGKVDLADLSVLLSKWTG